MFRIIHPKSESPAGLSLFGCMILNTNKFKFLKLMCYFVIRFFTFLLLTHFLEFWMYDYNHRDPSIKKDTIPNFCEVQIVLEALP